MMEAQMLHFKYLSSQWNLSAIPLPDIPLSSFEGGRILQRPRPSHNLSYQLEYEEIFSEFLDMLNYMLMEENSNMRGW